MQVLLSRTIAVRCVRALATLAFPKVRPVESALINWMEERLQAGQSITAESVCAEQTGLLPGRSEVLGQRLLSIAEELRLVDLSRGRITGLSDIGRKAQAEQKVYIPERCTWSLYFAADPLLTHSLIHFAPYQEPLAHEELGGGPARKREGPQRTFVDLPPELAALTGRTLELPSAEKPLVRLDAIEPKCEVADPETLTAEVLFSPDQVFTSRVWGNVDNARIDHKKDWPKLLFWDVFLYLLEQQQLASLWSADARALRHTFRQVAAEPATLRSFQRDIPMRQPTLGKLGPFKDTVIQKVPVVPASPADAQSWHDWLLLDGISDYRFNEQYQAHCADVAKRFPAFALAALDQATLAARVRANATAASPEVRPPARYWQLQAPLDLELEGLQ